MKRISCVIVFVVFFLLISTRGYSAPTLIDNINYNIELFASGAGPMHGIAFDNSGDMFFSNYDGQSIYKVTSPFQSGINSYDLYATGIPYAVDLAFTQEGRLFVTGSTNTVYEVFSDGSYSSFASGFSYLTSIESYGNDLFVSNSGNGTISKIDQDGNVSTFLSGFSSPHGPFGISIDTSGNLFFVDHGSGTVYSSDQAGNLTTLGSVSSLGGAYTGVRADGTVFVSDVNQGNLYAIDTLNNMSLFASGFEGKTNAPYNGPNDVAFNSGSMYIADGDNIWKVTTVVPEPISSILFLTGGGLLAGRRYFRRKK